MYRATSGGFLDPCSTRVNNMRTKSQSKEPIMSLSVGNQGASPSGGNLTAMGKDSYKNNESSRLTQQG